MSNLMSFHTGSFESMSQLTITKNTTRKNILDYFANGWELTEMLFNSFDPSRSRANRPVSVILSQTFKSKCCCDVRLLRWPLTIDNCDGITGKEFSVLPKSLKMLHLMNCKNIKAVNINSFE
jgi:hypothetical protein